MNVDWRQDHQGKSSMSDVITLQAVQKHLPSVNGMVELDQEA
jgi:hypothetical protein